MELSVQTRDILGKKVKALREGGLIPAELYGRGRENLHLSVSAKDFYKVFKEAGESSIIQLKITESQTNADRMQTSADNFPRESALSPRGSVIVNVLIHDTQRDPLMDEITHIDFYEVRMDEKITASVPLEFIGESPAVKEKEGVLIKAMQEIEVEALPADLPPKIEIDVSKILDIGESIYVKDIKVPAGVKFEVEPETVVATVIKQAKEEVPAEPMKVEDVKVEGEEKKEKDQPEKSE